MFFFARKQFTYVVVQQKPKKCMQTNIHHKNKSLVIIDKEFFQSKTIDNLLFQDCVGVSDLFYSVENCQHILIKMLFHSHWCVENT